MNASWSNIQHHGAAAFKLSERSPLPPALSAKDLPGGQSQVLNVCWIRRIDHHLTEHDRDCVPQSVSDTETWLSWIGHLDNPTEGKDDCEAHNESDVVLGNAIKSSKKLVHQVVSTGPHVPGLIRTTQRFTRQTVLGLLTVSAMETRRNNSNKKK